MTDMLLDLLQAKLEMAGAPKEASDVLAMLVRSKLAVLSDGAVKVLDDSGAHRIGSSPTFEDMTVDEYVAELAMAKPVLFGRSKPEPEQQQSTPTAPPANETRTERAIRESAELRRQAAATEAAKPKLNPWAEGAINKTMQVMIEAREPERAARLKAEAHATPVRIVNR